MPGKKSEPLWRRMARDLKQRRVVLMDYYEAMAAVYSPCNWWPGETPFEVAVGAVLTQNTAWRNVEKALENLKRMRAMTPRAMWRLSRVELEEALRPSGYYRVKAERLSNMLDFFARHNGAEPPEDCGLEFLRSKGDDELRSALLDIRGIGRESADAILLYALHRPTFVVDAYTTRVIERHALMGGKPSYEEIREFFMEALSPDTALYNEYHALLVRVGHHFCHKSKTDCVNCPLGAFL